MDSLKRLFILSFAFIIMFFGITYAFAEGDESTDEIQFTITIDANGGIEGNDFRSTIVLLAGENYAVSGLNENFLKAPEGKKFAAIELINKNGEVEGVADSVLLWGEEFCDNMTLKFYWANPISDIKLNMEYPNAGDSTTTPTDEYGSYEYDQQTNKPKVTIDSEYDIDFSFTEWVDIDSFNEEYEYYESPFIGTFEIGKKYYALVELHNKNNKDFAFNDSDLLNITLNGKKAKVYKVVDYSTSVSITLEIELNNDTYEVIKGSNQKVVSNESAEFEIDADYSLFENGGKVYIDDSTSPLDPANYTSRSGSTIISLNKEYINTLSSGEHTLKVVFNNDKTVSTTFIVEKDSTNELIPPHTGIDNPVTYDNILYYITIIIFSVTGISGIVLLRKREK